MNTLAVQRQSRPLLPELSALLRGLPALSELLPLFDTPMLRLEDEMTDDTYRVRAEVPGVDPIEDIEVTVCDGQLTIKAQRAQSTESNGHSEFVYGTFTRTVALPASADEDDISAAYDRGILTVSVPLIESQPALKHVEVVETILVDEDDSYDDDDEDEHDGSESSHDGDHQEQPVG